MDESGRFQPNMFSSVTRLSDEDVARGAKVFMIPSTVCPEQPKIQTEVLGHSLVPLTRGAVNDLMAIYRRDGIITRAGGEIYSTALFTNVLVTIWSCVVAIET